jgi:hypothetical protein
MLESQTRDKFKTNNWSKIIGNESNPHQFINRLRSRVNSALKDLSLIAERLPDKEFGKVFNVEGLGVFLKSLTLYQNDPDSKLIKRPQNHKIRLLLVERGLAELKDMTEKEYAHIPNLSRLISTKVNETYGICKDLLLDIERKELEKEAFNKDRLFLFKFSDLYEYVNFQPLNETIINVIKEKNDKLLDNLSYIQVANGQFTSPSDYIADIIDIIKDEKIGNCSLAIREGSTCILTIELGSKKSLIENLTYEKRNDDYLIYKVKPLKMDFNWKPNPT